MPILKVEKLRPKAAQNLHRFKPGVRGEAETRTQASRLPSFQGAGVCPHCVNSQEPKTKSPDSDSSTPSHGGDSPAGGAQGPAPARSAPGLAGQAADLQVGRARGSVERSGEGLYHLVCPGLSPEPPRRPG